MMSDFRQFSIKHFQIAFIFWVATIRPSAAGVLDSLEESGVHGGIIVHIGCDAPSELLKLRRNNAYVIQCLDTDVEKVRHARDTFSKLKSNGPVTARQFDGKHLPYIGNLINLIIVDDLGSLRRDEILRALAPYGVAMIGGDKIVKPYPKEMDDWPQYCNKADNNAVSKDTLVGPPRHLQWVTNPASSRSHMTLPTITSLVTTHGRVFSIEDQATAENPFLPGRFALIARDAFNGVLLWKRPIRTWESITRYIKKQNVQLQRRVAAVDDRVYCTLGIDAPICELAAATGDIRRTFAGTKRTQELAYADGTLYAIVGDRMNAATKDNYDNQKVISKAAANAGTDTRAGAAFAGCGFSQGYARRILDKEHWLCSIVAIDAATGDELWRTPNIEGYIGGSLSVEAESAVYLSHQRLTCLDSRTGKERWTASLSKQKGNVFGDGTAPDVVVISGNRVYASVNRRFWALSLSNGDIKWDAPITKNYRKSVDLLVVAGTPWTGGQGIPTCFDAETGQRKKQLVQKMTVPMGHDRCYRNFSTESYYINSKSGGADFLDLRTGQEFPNHWVRGTCGAGLLPANGLLYAPPASCQCSMGTMLQNFNALYAEPNLVTPSQMLEVQRTPRLIKGPAFGTKLRAPAAAGDWPVFRHDNERGASTISQLAPKPMLKWSVKFPGMCSAPIVIGDRVYLAEIEAHTIHAIDAATGASVWHFTAGGRVDSPPTYYRGLLLFGSRDGWITCLRAADGAMVWQFRDLPDRLLGAFNQLESVWPINGSVVVKNETLYFGAGRSSYVDGGIFVYALDPATGAVKKSRQIYGTFDGKNGFPMYSARCDADPRCGFKNDIMVECNNVLYVRHKGFNPDLSDAQICSSHILPSSGFLDRVPQHRTYWTINTGYGVTGIRGVDVDILALEGDTCYAIQGFPTNRHSFFDPRKAGYRLFATTLTRRHVDPHMPLPPLIPTRKSKKSKGHTKLDEGPGIKQLWSTHIPLAARAVIKAGNTVCIAGVPMKFHDLDYKKFEAAYENRQGGILWFASAADGSVTSQITLAAAPAWDSMAAANNSVYVVLRDGSLVSFGGGKK